MICAKWDLKILYRSGLAARNKKTSDVHEQLHNLIQMLTKAIRKFMPTFSSNFQGLL